MARIGLDLDGCFYAFENSYRQHLVTNCGFEEEQCPPSDSWEFYLKWGQTLPEFLKAFADGVDAGIIFTWGEPYEGSVEPLSRLVGAGHTLHVVTDRSMGSPGAAQAATVAWLAKYLPPVQSITFTRDKTIANIDYMVDDKLENYDALYDAGVFAYLLDRPWNQAPGDDRLRVHTMSDFVNSVLECEREINEWVLVH